MVWCNHKLIMQRCSVKKPLSNELHQEIVLMQIKAF